MPSPTPDIDDLLARFGLGEEDRAAWLASDLPPASFTDWLTDRVARWPSGLRARHVYGADEVHDFARRAILTALRLGPGDHVLDIGCGGGLLLRDAMRTGSAATGLDHSEDMVALARERARGATLVLGDALDLPFAADTFSAVSMSVVFFFFDHPVLALVEARRVLRKNGRLAVYTTAPELRGTGAAPEPLATRGHFWTDAQLASFARRAGFEQVHVANEDGGQLLTARAEESDRKSSARLGP